MTAPINDTPPDHLSRISTMWTAVRRAHGQDPDAANAAQNEIMDRYAATIYRYLLKVLRDEDAADEVFQEFALQFVRGGFKQANPQRGRFRDYLKISILRIVSRYRQRRAGRNRRVTDNLDEAEIPAESPCHNLDEEFVANWRDELLERAWQKLKTEQTTSGQPHHAILALRARQPEWKSEELSAELNRQLQPPTPYTAAGTRKLLQRARERFADILLDEVEQTLGDVGREQLEQEVIELGLHAYCRSALKRRFNA
jgi:RNA polymerase sigma-70 factor (ECF subfamily)